jgi:hypothetical protein
MAVCSLTTPKYGHKKSLFFEGSFFYSYLLATRREGIENMGNIDVFAPRYGTS